MMTENFKITANSNEFSYNTEHNVSEYKILCVIWYHFVIKNVKKHQWKSITFRKLAGL